MDHREVHRLLVQASAIDGRIVTELTVAAWADTNGMSRVALDDAIAALNMHRAESPGVWVEPGHIIANARRVQAQRERDERLRRPALETQVTLDPEGHREATARAAAWFREHPGASTEDYLKTLHD